jgi:hypothetical protein
LKKIEKKLSLAEKKGLKTLIEDFLERERKEISSLIEDAAYAEEFWGRLEAVLFRDTFWMDEADAADKVGVDYGKLILGYHNILKPVWDQLREKLFDYSYRVIPERKKSSTLREYVKKDRSSFLSEYRKLIEQNSVIDSEKFYDIKVTVSFDPGRITFFKRSLNILKNFMDLLEDIPISYFAKCGHCGKCIILTRSDRRFCPGCAAKKYQKDKWEKDPEGMKQREKERYHTRRKR